MSYDLKQSTADPAAVDVGNRAIQERVVSKTIQTALFTTNANAVWAGANNLRKESYPYAAISFPANRKAFRLEVGDCFKFSYARYGVSEMICRVIQITEEGPESESITVHAMEDMFAISTAITEYYDPTSHAVGAPDYTVAPFTYERIEEAPYALSADIKLLPMAGRESAYDLGYAVYMSSDAGASYTFLQKIGSLRPIGTLVTAYSADTLTIDDAGMTVEILRDANLVETITWADVFSGAKNLGLIDDEIISFQSVTPDAEIDDQYVLGGVVRGRFGTTKAAHAEDAALYIFTSAASISLISNTEIVTGAVRKFKFVPYNMKQSDSIADCSAIDITIEGVALTPYMPTNLEANDIWANSLYTSPNYDDDIVLTWSERYRGKGAGIGTPGIVLPETGHEGYYKVEVYVATVLMRTTDAIATATWTYTEAMNLSDNTNLAAEVVLKVSNYRTEGGHTYESDQAEITVTLNV